MKAAACWLSLAPAKTAQEKPDRPTALWGRRHKHLVIHWFLLLPLAEELGAVYSTALKEVFSFQGGLK